MVRTILMHEQARMQLRTLLKKSEMPADMSPSLSSGVILEMES